MDNCVINPNQECLGYKKALEVEKELETLQTSNAHAHEKFGERIGSLEQSTAIMGVKFDMILEQIGMIKTSINTIQADYRTLSDKLIPVANKINDIETLRGDIDIIKQKPAKRWEVLTENLFRWIVLGILAAAAAAMGISAFFK